ncbi:MAG: citramalate synthase [Elusimicrobia bacterium CG_4_10_14_0_8_um_filter_37_32]|nr:MAG: citramalate synthase [Elusimicrobia bacterium CG02_land_8_20_14_3_00_37_13]PIZ14037.1 MAG: citramalate synthase [Elusimicrobia bacterium CG_4_10_14_0_8_um_filter_37_32]
MVQQVHRVKLLDTTLRDGTQMSGISFSVEDKIKIAKAIDELGVHYIEGGWPGSNIKDNQFFKEIRKIKLKNSEIVAFGSTRHKNNKPQEDRNLLAIVNTKVKTSCIFGKSWDLHVIHALGCSLDENLKMIDESIRFLREKGLKVIYDAEHFFDGFKAKKEYALKTIETAKKAGAFNITLCDTNGGTLPDELREIIHQAKNAIGFDAPDVSLGIHTHNDSDCAVANSIIAVDEGCTLIHGTINGYGERCGNANLCSVIPDLQLKSGINCISQSKMSYLTELSRYVSEIANIAPSNHQPYVGYSAFAHKGGVHVSAMARNAHTYEHVDPKVVGNERRVLISELSGRSNVELKVKELRLDFVKDKDSMSKIINLIKKLEHKGYQFEDANASFLLVVRKVLGKYKPFFELKGFRVIVESDPKTNVMHSEATIKLEVNGKEEHTASVGEGPVNALDNALRKALEKFYPQLAEMSLGDFKVRVINAEGGTAAKVRVLIESRDKEDSWGTIGVSENIIEASWEALVDAVEFKLLK